MRYYWCVNCGYSHDYGKDKKRGIGTCLNCKYDEVLELDEEDWNLEEVKVRNQGILGEGRIFIGKKEPIVSDEQLDQWLSDIKEGKDVSKLAGF